VKPRIRRRVRRPPDLTSLFDVLFIVVFAALIRAAAAQQALAQATAPPPRPAPQPPPPPPALAALRTRALATIGAELAERTPLVIRVSAAGTVTAIEADGKQLALDVPLLEHSPDPTVRTSYLGDRSAELRVCRIAAVHLGVPDLARYLVIVAPSDLRTSRLVALNDGLDADRARCFIEQHGFATVIEPSIASPNAP